MRLRHRGALVALIPFLLAAACAPMLTPQQKIEAMYPAFPVEEYAPYAQPGTATLAGQVFLKTVGGDVKYGAGSEVWLDPVTSYSKVWWEHWGRLWKQRFVGPPAHEFFAARRKTIADGEGRFKFKDLPAGSYYIRSQVTWGNSVNIGFGALPTTEGGLVTKAVALKDGEEQDLVLTW